MRHRAGRVFFVCAAVVLAAISAPALAQDTYYKEMTIDGRL